MKGVSITAITFELKGSPFSNFLHWKVFINKKVKEDISRLNFFIKLILVQNC